MMARFHRYSWGNLLLIYTQCPDASHVAGYNTWKQLGRQVRLGAKGIRILAPIIIKDPKTPDKETVVAFRTAYVFDVSQTNGKPLSDFARVRGEPGIHLARLKKLIADWGILLEYSSHIFRVRSVVQGRSTAVCVVLDASGSMTSRKMDVARQAMRVLLEALADLKIATEAFTFTTGDRFSLAEACRVSGQEHSRLQTRFSRFGNLEIGLVKRFEEPVKSAMKRLPSIRGSGLTPLGEAMQVGAVRLVTRSESRKIMVVLTDGKAGCESGDAAASQHAQHVAGQIARSGMELVGVGIQDDSLRAIVADTIVIHALDDLPAQLCKLLSRTLQKGLSHVG